MATITDVDIKELKEFISTGFEQLNQKIEVLDHKIDIQTEMLNQKIEALDQKIDSQTDRLDKKIEALDKKQDIYIAKSDERMRGIEIRLDGMQISINKIPELAERMGELKNWRQIALIVITGTFGSIFGWLIKSGRL